MSALQTVFYLLIIALATFAQNLTGFAFGLIFVGVAGATHLLSIEDAANIACLLMIVNGAAYLRSHRVRLDWPLMGPIVISSLVGLALGVLMLHWLSGNALNGLRMLLGAAIVTCAVLLIQQNTKRAQHSGKAATWSVGLFSGVLGGLFATPGPPMAYYLYRQPLQDQVVRECMFVLLISCGVLRLLLLLPQGQISAQAWWGTLWAAPVVWGVTWAQARRPPRIPRRAMEWLVCLLLLLSGTSLLWSGWRAGGG